MQKQIPQSFNLSPIMMVFAFIILILLAYGGILLQTWQTLVIKNNIFTSANNLLDAFKKAILKSLKVCLVIIVLLPIFTFLQFIVIKTFPSYINFLPLLYIPFIPLVMLFFGIVLQDAKFINVLADSAGVCFTHYFRILGYMILLIIIPIITTILMGILMLIPLFWFIAIILMVLFQLMIAPFFYCFFTELYFDLVIIDEDLTNSTESYPEIIDITQPQESKNQEVLPQQEQQVHKEETLEGLRPLGGN